jgi:hypothetical protein
MITASNLISFDEDILTSIEVYDSSTYSGSSVYDVTAVRFMFATVNSVNGASTVSTLEPWRQYTLNQNTTINGVSYLKDAVVYLANEYNLAGSDTATETGFYGERQTWIPSDLGYVSFNPDQTYNTTSLVFEDNVFTLNYQLFTTSYAAGSNRPAGTYIVVATPSSDVVTIAGGNRYAGEVFTSASPFTFTGLATISLLEAEATTYFCTTGQIYQTLQRYIILLANNANASIEIKNNLLKVIANYNVAGFSEAQSYGIDLQYMQNLLTETQEFYSIIEEQW